MEDCAPDEYIQSSVLLRDCGDDIFRKPDREAGRQHADRQADRHADSMRKDRVSGIKNDVAFPGRIRNGNE